MEDRIKKEILQKTKTIAIVGLSDRPERPSFRVAKYLQEKGYRIIPVNPRVEEVLGEKSFASLNDIPFSVDLVDVFRRSEEVPALLEEAAQKKIPWVWLQLGVTCPEESEQTARQNGVQIIKDCCIMVEHKRLIG
ncbi:hypothetical protein SAMN02745221_01430 [Thermosyntropha lipolytica DSM 11003]|uniref:CoA-binding domain-containing protein n=1 Tax=Thermosyntropha lipolytica DSM 11003 TaxID=1123382 RepID=A0A1M5PB48_9FIRM|nr:hypothetical protein SAMN02745221_01430 [Thermosyntropha lipolytica DSM 11003]